MSLKTISAADLLRMPFNAPVPLLSPFLIECGYTVIQAREKAGKTWAALGIAAAVAGGGTFLGGRVEQPRPVIYVDAENGAWRMRQRLRYVLASIDGGDADLAGENLHILGAREHDDDGGESPFPLIDGGDGSRQYVELVREHNAALLIVDTKAKLTRYSDESSAADDVALSQTVRQVQAEGCAVMVLHHIAQGRDAFDPTASRGSTALAGSADLILGVKKQPKVSPEAVAHFWMAVAESRDGDEVDVTAELAPEGDAWRWQIAEVDRAESQAPGVDNVERMMRVARSGQYGRLQDLAAALGWRSDKLSKVKGRAAKSGRIERGELEAVMNAEPVF